MKADLAIINGLLVDSKTVWPGVLYINEGKIIGITQSLENRPSEVIDANGLYILPGAIDGHVHMMDPGYTDREDFITGTRAAARGGVTTVIDHHRTKPQVFGRKGVPGKEGIPEDPFRRRFRIIGRFEPNQSWKPEGPVGRRSLGLQGVHM